MSDVRTCPVCNGKVPPSVERCPRCLLAPVMTSLAGVSAEPGKFVPPSPAELATLIPEVEIIDLIGRGGMGAVYLAQQTELDRLVAIKLLPVELSQNPEFEERFRRETRALGHLNHPNIVTLYDSGTTAAGHGYFIMEFVDGMSLAEKRKMFRFPDEVWALLAEVVDVMIQVCEALDYAHHRGVVHRDINPANVLIRNDGRVKVVDFGLVKLSDAHSITQTELTLTRSTLGTLKYMAPEQSQPKAKVDHRADIYSAGVMLYQLLTNELPEGVFEPPSKLVPGLDKRVDAIVHRAMQNAPERRFPSAGKMADALRSMASGRMKRPAYRRLAALSLGAVAFILLALALYEGTRDRMPAPGEAAGEKMPVASTPAIPVFSTDPSMMIQPAHPESGAAFGQTLAFKDGVLAVGAPQIGGNGHGYVSLYELLKDAPQPRLMTTLRPAENSEDPGFGETLSLDIDQLAVGQATLRNGGGERSVYLFRRRSPGSPWEEVTRLGIPGGDVADPRAGLLLQGERLFAGAPGYASSGVVFAYALDRSSAQISLIQTISPTGSPGESFGRAMALRDKTLWVSQPSSATSKANIRLFALDPVSGMWRQERELVDPVGQPREEWGLSLAFNGRLLAVGAPNRSTSDVENAGHVSLFVKRDADWELLPPLVPSMPNGRFGETLQWIDEKWLLVAAPDEKVHDGGGSGAVYLFKQSEAGDSLHLTGKISPHAGEVARLGSALEVAGSFLAVSAEEPSPGRVYLLPLKPMLGQDTIPEPPAQRPWSAIPDFGRPVFEDVFDDGLVEQHGDRQRYVSVIHDGKSLKEDSGHLMFAVDGAPWAFASLRDQHIHRWDPNVATLSFVWELGNVVIAEDDPGNEDYNISIRLLSARQDPADLGQRTFRLETAAAQLDLAIFFNGGTDAFMKLDYKDGTGQGEHAKDGHGQFIGQAPLPGWDGSPGSGVRQFWIRLTPEGVEAGWDGGLERIQTLWQDITLDPAASHGFGAGIWVDHLGKNIWAGRGGHQVARYAVYEKAAP